MKIILIKKQNRQLLHQPMQLLNASMYMKFANLGALPAAGHDGDQVEGGAMNR
jgi:hypothetical protein